MPRLEARFHPWQSTDESYVVVGYVVWDATGGKQPVVQAASSLREAHAPGAILATLRHLVGVTRADCDRLVSLRTRFWSFVPADDLEPRRKPDAGPVNAPATP